jgi:hypothetical protein
MRKITIKAGGISGLNDGAIDDGMFGAITVTTSGITLITFLDMTKPETTIALYRRLYTRIDFK